MLFRSNDTATTEIYTCLATLSLHDALPIFPLRPLTHDLFRDVLEVLNVQLRTVNISALRDGIFYADLVFSNGAEVSARPSDSIALALRTGATIFASDEILDEAGVAIPDEQEDEVEKFREFLDTISPEDFGRAT